MIHWENLDKRYSKSDQARWRRDFCAWATREHSGDCIGYGHNDGDEPCLICQECDQLNVNNWDKGGRVIEGHFDGVRAGEWIPISEKMPPASDENSHDADVLLWVPRAKHQGGHPYLGHPRKTKTKDDPKGEHNFWGIPTEGREWIVWGWSHFEKLPTPTHWMPLPNDPNCDAHVKGAE